CRRPRCGSCTSCGCAPTSGERHPRARGERTQEPGPHLTAGRSPTALRPATPPRSFPLPEGCHATPPRPAETGLALRPGPLARRRLTPVTRVLVLVATEAPLAPLAPRPATQAPLPAPLGVRRPRRRGRGPGAPRSPSSRSRLWRSSSAWCWRSSTGDHTPGHVEYSV